MAIAVNPCFVIDCPDPGELAGFYATLLGWEARDDGDWAEISAADGSGSICFQQVTGYSPPGWPGQLSPQQMHLDVTVDDLDEGERQVVAIGATRSAHQPGETFRVFLDPAGHPFCLCLPAE